MYVGLHEKCPFFFADFNETLIFSTDFRKVSTSNFMKIRPVGAELFHAYSRTDTTNLTTAFHNFAYSLNKWWCFSLLMPWSRPGRREI